MNENSALLIAIVVLFVTALAAFASYKRRQRGHAREVGNWVDEYLAARYGELPKNLNVNCSNDALWPVLVSFDNPRTGIRHRLQFACPGPHSTFSLLSEVEENS